MQLLWRRQSMHSLDEDSVKAEMQPAFFATLAVILAVTVGLPAVLASHWDVPLHDRGPANSQVHGCQMAIARFLDHKCSGLKDYGSATLEKGSNFAIW